MQLEEKIEVADFAKTGLLVLPKLIEPRKVYDHLLARLASDSATADQDTKFAPSSLGFYNDPLAGKVQLDLLPHIEKITGMRLAPTFSYIRLYETGALLRMHRDRPACEISLSIHLGRKDSQDWEIYFLDTEEQPIKFFQKAGDAILYLGCERCHWRPRYQGSGYGQMFLHYVNKDGPRKLHAHDYNSANLRFPKVYRILQLLPIRLRTLLKRFFLRLVRYL